MSDLAVAAADVAVLDEMSPFAKGRFEQKYAHDLPDGRKETWPEAAHRVTTNVMGALGYELGDPEFDYILDAITQRKFVPGGRYLYASGRGLHQTQNCLLLRAEDSREGWAELQYKAAMALMTGAGIGVVYSDIREKGAPISKTGGLASGPLSLMGIINETGRRVMQGGSRRSAIWAGLHWNHPDVFDFIECKNWSKEVRELKEKDFNFPAEMELTNISVILDDDFFAAYDDPEHEQHGWANSVYFKTVKQMVKTGEPGFSIDVGENAGENLRNACTEVTSYDDSDICNLGSINMARVESLAEMETLVEHATLFLLAGTVYSDLPYEKVHEVRAKNRRLGLGLMGLHEWLLKHGYRYEPNPELGEYLDVYMMSDGFAAEWAEIHGLSTPVKTRAIAPTGTIGIIAETTTGIEPIFALAYQRRYLEGEHWKYEYVVDPTGHRAVTEYGVKPSTIQDAYTLALDVEKRLEFQAWVQQYVDHGISSTINLPAPIRKLDEVREFADMLYPYLPKLRGITCYPDGARGGQPLSVTSYEWAMKHKGLVFETEEETCVGGICGS